MSSAPVDVANPEPEEDDDGEMPRARITRREAVILGIFVVVAVGFLYFGLPQIAGLNETWDRIRDGDPIWLLICLLFEIGSFLGYMWLFEGVFVRGSRRITWKASYEITMAGLAATRLFATAGAGGIALTAWALRQAGMSARTVAVRMVAKHVILYGVYLGTLVIVGLGLHEGLLSGSQKFAITVVPAILAFGVLVIVVAFSLVPTHLDRGMAGWRHDGASWVQRGAANLAKAPAALSGGVREAGAIIRERDGAVLGALLWWYLDIGCLWAAFHAFGAPPPFFVIVMAYFVGTLGNLLPLPGGIGGVDGGMIGTFIAFGVDDSLAIVAVLTYRAFAFWLPTIPGIIAYLQLRKTVQGWRDERELERARNGAAIPGTIQSEVIRTTPRTTST